jgi:hypothetical protein
VSRILQHTSRLSSKLISSDNVKAQKAHNTQSATDERTVVKAHYGTRFTGTKGLSATDEALLQQTHSATDERTVVKAHYGTRVAGTKGLDLAVICTFVPATDERTVVKAHYGARVPATRRNNLPDVAALFLVQPVEDQQYRLRKT